EVMLVTAVGTCTGGNATVTRGRLGTSGQSFSSGTDVYDITLDRIFVSVPASGNAGGCSGACLYSLDVTTGQTSISVHSYLTVTGGTSGVIIDNNTAPGTLGGAIQTYFSSLGTMSCTTISGSRGCAVQASQAALQ
ncbi:MAG TPA: hypothetical protein VK419_17810, partial [Bryobacteraceae bacterium]|nr:hypothetical protein [Bryobacteraceae bacterium]